MGQVNVNTGGGRRWYGDNGAGAGIALLALIAVAVLIWFLFFNDGGSAAPDNGGTPATQGQSDDQGGGAPAPSGWRLEYLA